MCPRWNSVPGSVCDLARGEIIASNVRPRRPGQPVLVPAVEHRTRRIFPYSTTTTKVVTPPVIVNLRRRCSHLDVRGTHFCKNLGYDRCQICCPVVHVGCPVVCEPTERVSINVRVVRVQVDIMIICGYVRCERSGTYVCSCWKVLVFLFRFEGFFFLCVWRPPIPPFFPFAPSSG